MSFKKLFQKRNSIKEISVVKLANEEIEKLKSATKSSTMSETCDDVIPEDIKRSYSLPLNEDYLNKYEYIEKEVSLSNIIENQMIYENKNINPQKIERSMSVPCEAQTSNLERIVHHRKKCYSESKDSNGEDEDYIKRITELKDKHLEDVIGRYINNLIQESIITAVKNVNIEEILENITSSRSSSSNSNQETTNINSPECLNDERKWSDSLAEYSELGGKAKSTKSEMQKDSFSKELKTENNDNTSDVKGTETASLDGYGADSESINLNSEDLELETSQNTNNSSEKTDEQLVSNILSDDNCKNGVNESNNKKYDHEKHSTKQDDSYLSSSESNIKYEDTQDLNEPNASKNIEIIISDANDSRLTEVGVLNDPLTLKSENSENVEPSLPSKSIEIYQSNDSSKLDETAEESNICENKSDRSDEEPDLMLMSSESDSRPTAKQEEVNVKTLDVESLPKQQTSQEEDKKKNWKVGYLYVKLPQKKRSKGLPKAWKKRCVSIQPDEFVHDPKNPTLMINVFRGDSGSSRKHGASFWKSISCQTAVIYRSSSQSHKYTFTISEENKVVIHLAADSESATQEWMAAIRSILWPPSPVILLEKMLHGKEFEISIIDNDFAMRAGLLGMYGYLTVTPKKLILVHPQQGYVIQEWYLNTVDKFQLIPQSKAVDVNKILAMTTCSDSSTGKGDLLIFCNEAIALLQAVASTIVQILTEHTEQEGGKYEKELAEMADWLAPAVSQKAQTTCTTEDYYQVPPRQVKSLLDIPNFIFDKPLTQVSSASCKPGENLETAKTLFATNSNNSLRASQDSGISAASEDFLNCSTNSFALGSSNLVGKSSDSELSDCYTPPRSPVIRTKQHDDNVA